ncbi:MAG: hypothetical protein KGL65_08745 [Rhodospirillales bacterium]|nr:hypothetical protein [Rhodospirillales bacterium]MDE2391681.1 hypothetical protein [Rhodospirillales bacterium]
MDSERERLAGFLNQGYNVVAAANTFHILAVMLTKYPSILDKKRLFGGVSSEFAFQLNNPGLVIEGFALVHCSPRPRTCGQ